MSATLSGRRRTCSASTAATVRSDTGVVTNGSDNCPPHPSDTAGTTSWRWPPVSPGRRTLVYAHSAWRQADTDPKIAWEADVEPVLLMDDPLPRVRRLTLNRPEKRNALNDTLRQALFDALRAADDDREVSAVIIRRAGPRFSAGYDP